MSKDSLKRVPFRSLRTILARHREGTLREVFDDWRWILSYSRNHRGAIALYTIFGVVSSTFGIVASIAGKYMIDIITGYQENRLPQLVILMLGSAAFSITLTNVVKRFSAKLSIRIGNAIRADIFDKIINTEWLAISGYRKGDILNRFNSDVSTVSENAITWLPTVVTAFYSFAATFFVIMHYNVIMALLAFAGAPVMLFMSKYLLEKQREYGRRMKEARSDMMTFEVETFYNIDTVKSYGITDLYSRKMRMWQERYADIYLSYNMFTIRTSVFLTILGHIVQYAAFGYCLYLLWNHSITYGTMTLFLTQRVSLQNAFNKVVGLIPSFLGSSVSANRIRELTQLPKEKRTGKNASAPADRPGGYEVSMEHVTFSYQKGKPVITDSDFRAHPGGIVALVGPSGEGKTTMIRLILGLVEPQEGMVEIRSGNTTGQDGSSQGASGEDVRYSAFSARAGADVRHLFSYVPQGNSILSGTIAENLRMVKEDASDEELTQALKDACAWDFVSEMPEGINSSVGEKGGGLSEGQAQRIAIARAVLRDAPVLLLDEATSALDVQTEREVLRNVVRRNPSRTCIVTTHRPTVLNLCDRVYRVVDTHVVELSEQEASRMAIEF